MTDEQYIQLADNAVAGAREYVRRLRDRKAHRESQGRKLSAADIEQSRQIRDLLNQAHDVTSQLLDDGRSEARLLAMRHRLRQVELMNL